MGHGSSSYHDRERIWKNLLLYAASPLVVAVGLVAIVFPYLILVIAGIVGLVVWFRD